jgi:hypothetical protein
MSLPLSLCRYTEQEEVIHDPGTAELYNESVYLNFAAAGDGPAGDVLGGVVRVGLRPNEGYSEFFFMIALSDGSTLYWSGRNPIERAAFPIGSSVWDASSLSLSVTEPGVVWQVSYADDQTRRIAYATELDQLGQALKRNSPVACTLELTFTRTRGLHVMQPTGEMIPGEDAAKDHYEQFGVAAGTLTVDGRSYVIAGAHAFRDHSWGPRNYVSAMANMDWFTVQLDGGGDFVGYRIHSRPDLPIQGARIDDDGATFLDDVVVHSDWDGGGALRDPVSIDLVVAGDPVAVDIEVVRAVRVKHRSAAGVVNNTFGLIHVKADGREGGGWLDLNRPSLDA